MIEQTFECIDAHTCGNPVRLIKSGGPDLEGANMSEKRQHFMREYDWVRKGLMFEPRGHDMMSGSILYPPHDPQNDFSILFIETSGCLPMCGHGTIGTITIAIEEGLVTPKIPGKIRMEAPAGLVEIEYQQTGKKVDWVKITNVKSYLAARDLTIEYPGLGLLNFDVAYGGNFYAIVDPQKNYNGLENLTAAEIVRMSQYLRKSINEQYPDQFIHPEDPTIRDVSHMLWTGKPLDSGSSGRNAVFYGDKAIDRSPCGTGTSARMAQLYTKGRLKPGKEFIHESYIGSRFVGRIEQETTLGEHLAIVPSIQGWAQVFGRNTITINEKDPYAFGFQVI
ncbi:4-hydroxyproline epimerase [Antarcticibacterium flavum]|uniref:4-hydroxyproline epimerase n=1 Tax=Antarcticibacterium flavum TaxID=2058175 RepID=A0A5B7X5J3_9FLAO|nr:MULTISPECIES: 4-hydroxyproline epimerase [Antarcticibacterium]MCM4159690.1 4-hydroxyproline epimerase [Antarcticibacterium sp. W02-3]QCY70629.1 4-hydroxyproline epimerase [Antarcticibacterium flavum]